ncbi:MAG: DUF3291 domain-containing protein [Bacteroidota bacterium]
MMQFAHSSLKNSKGLRFYRLLGSGKGEGFNPFPDWSVYALLQVWDSEAHANEFFSHSDLIQRYRAKTREVWTIYMRSMVAKGLWDKQQPFEKSKELDSENPTIAVITRATIKTSQLLRFWRYVPTSEKPLAKSDGLLFKKGIGEAPIFQMATFSLWSSADALHQFAYKSKEHRVAIEKTQELNWYSEELFSRFQPYRSVGTWNGTAPLPELKKSD